MTYRTDDLRIRAALPTPSWLTERGAKGTCCTHLGRPKGEPDPKFSVAPVRARLAELAPGVELLENVRFHAGETTNDPAFVAELIAGHDLYVNDAFGASHRAHASIVGPPEHLPSAAGRLLAKEVEVILGIREDPAAKAARPASSVRMIDNVSSRGMGAHSRSPAARPRPTACNWPP